MMDEGMEEDSVKNNGNGVSDSGIAHIFSSDDVRLLAEIGFMALAVGRKKTARQLFNALLVLRGGSEASIVAEASFQLSIGESGRAVQILQQAEPSDRISALLATALLGTRRNNEAIELLRARVAEQPDTSPFASRILQELEADPTFD